MRFANSLKTLAGSVAVYVMVAACSGRELAGGVGGGSSSSMSSATSSGKVSSATSVADPVPEAHAESGTRLKSVFMLGEDGSKSYDGWWDSKRGDYCGFMLMVDGTNRCVPFGHNASVFYTDALCTMRVAVKSVSPGACARPAPYAVETVFFSACDVRYRFYEIGASMVPAEVYMKAVDGVCVKLGGASAKNEYYATGAEVPPSAFVAGTEGHE